MSRQGEWLSSGGRSDDLDTLWLKLQDVEESGFFLVNRMIVRPRELLPARAARPTEQPQVPTMSWTPTELELLAKRLR